MTLTDKIPLPVSQPVPKTEEAKLTTATLLAKDRARAADVLLQLHYQLSRTVSSIEIK
jgi:hypothetical protein